MRGECRIKVGRGKSCCGLYGAGYAQGDGGYAGLPDGKVFDV